MLILHLVVVVVVVVVVVYPTVSAFVALSNATAKLLQKSYTESVYVT